MKRVLPALILILFLGGCGGAAPARQMEEPLPPVEKSEVLSSDVQAEENGQLKQEQGQETIAPSRPPAYDFSRPAPEADAAPDDYFSDAAFIGDSRTEGLLLYGGIAGEDLTYNGLNIFNLFTKACIRRDGRDCTILEVLETEQYGKIYLSLGINELGYPYDEKFYEAYLQATDTIRSLQPEAVIYLQGLIPLNEDVIKSTGGKDYLKNQRLESFDDMIRQVAQEKQVVYLDLNALFRDEEGILPAEASSDGVHLRAAWCKQWADYLKTHTVDGETQKGERGA